MTTSVFCTFRVAGFHHWPTAPDKYAYLRHAHRHVFYVRVDAKVEDKDRAIEFIEFKHHAERRFGFLSNEGVSGRLMICGPISPGTPDILICIIISRRSFSFGRTG